jgi:hypothetical protein
MVPISAEPVDTIPEARLGGVNIVKDFEKQSRTQSAAIFTLSGLDWGAGVSAAAHSPGISKGRKVRNVEKRPRRTRKQSGTEVKKDTEKKDTGDKRGRNKRREGSHERQEKSDTAGQGRRNHSEPRSTPRRNLSKRDKRNRRQNGTSRSNSPGESLSRGRAAASSTTLEVSRKAPQRNPSVKRMTRRGVSAESVKIPLPKVDGSLKNSLRW